MNKCENCKVKIQGNTTRCPLCQGQITNNNQEEIFPIVPLVSTKYQLFFKTLLLLSVITSIICLIVNYSISQKISWSWFVILGLISNFIVLNGILKKTNNIARLIFMQLIIIMFLSIIWDLITGFHRFSITFVLPIISVFIMINMGVIAKINKLRINDYFIYIIWDIILGIIPIIFIATNFIDIITPSYICIFTSLISLSILIIFKGREMKEELIRFFHL